MNTANQTARMRYLDSVEWKAIVARYDDHEEEPHLRRRHRRFRVGSGTARLSLAAIDAGKSNDALVINVSESGLMVKSFDAVIDRGPVTMQVRLPDETFTLNGLVRHCTQTVGGYKVGIELQFGSV